MTLSYIKGLWPAHHNAIMTKPATALLVGRAGSELLVTESYEQWKVGQRATRGDGRGSQLRQVEGSYIQFRAPFPARWASSLK